MGSGQQPPVPCQTAALLLPTQPARGAVQAAAGGAVLAAAALQEGSHGPPQAGAEQGGGGRLVQHVQVGGGQSGHLASICSGLLQMRN